MSRYYLLPPERKLITILSFSRSFRILFTFSTENSSTEAATANWILHNSSSEIVTKLTAKQSRWKSFSGLKTDYHRCFPNNFAETFLKVFKVDFLQKSPVTASNKSIRKLLLILLFFFTISEGLF